MSLVNPGGIIHEIGQSGGNTNILEPATILSPSHIDDHTESLECTLDCSLSSPSTPEDKYTDLLTTNNIPDTPMINLQIPSVPQEQTPILIQEPKRSNRTRNPNSKFIGNEWVNLSVSKSGIQGYHRPISTEAKFIASLHWDTLEEDIDPRYQMVKPINDPFTWETRHHHLSYQVKVQSTDSPSLSDVLQLSDTDERNGWFKAMDEEINALFEKNILESSKNYCYQPK
jgi:hypothetical protein